ncbi:hypothetical protein H1R20_g3882, partial [Candolleomyces eurysporus]
MPSLFSRTRTFSTPGKKQQLSPDDAYDEFGRVSSRQSATPTSSKKDKKKEREQAKRSGTLPPSALEHEVPDLPDGTFLPLNLEKPRTEAEAAGQQQPKDNDYGYLCTERHVVLGLEQLERLVEVVCDELESRGGITTPFIFSNKALDLSSSGIKKLIHSFIDTCAPISEREAQVAEHKWREEARFAGPHELGMCLRWGLARVIRSVGGQDIRGLVSWEYYAEWRDSEAAFHHAYMHYLRAVNAMEHILLAFIRWQDAPRSTTGSAAALGVPTRLKEWIKGYPANLPALQNPKAKPQPRKGARTIRVMSVRRNVRMYTPDLVKSASTWGQKNPSSTSLHNSFAHSKEWERIAPSTLKLPPRYSEFYKKKMNMSNNFHPEVTPGAYGSSPVSSISTAPSLSMSSTLSSANSSSSSDYFGLSSTKRSDDHFRSLTDLKWGEFEDMGFSSIGDDKKLQFDLTESARQERKNKRQTLDWNDFSTAGFTRMDAPLSATLQFSTPVLNTVSSWPTQQAEIHKKLKKQQKTLPSFGWDTEPVIGNEEVIEESFVDVFCDLIYGGGWMDLERGEALDRDCNWALVEYKALPPSRTTASGGKDPRTDTTLILFEEFVPFEYRHQLALPKKARRRLPSLFSPSRKQWKPAATLNGRPYVVGSVPRSPSYREVEFEGLLSGTGGTKVLSLSKRDNRVHSTISNAQATDLSIPPPPTRPAPTLATAFPQQDFPRPPPKTDEILAESPQMYTPTKKSRFRIPVPSPGSRRSMVPAEYSTVEFQTRMASYSDDEQNGTDEPEEVKQKRRESRSDAWVDILVNSQDRRLNNQSADPAERRKARIRSSDPDIASLEVAQVLAAVQDRSISPTSIPDNDYDSRFDQDVDEVETVPHHRRNVRDEDEMSQSEAHLAYDQETNEGDIDEALAPIMNARQMARQQRRLGYFDLHPERRPVSKAEEDPRERLARDESDSEEGVEDQMPVRPLPVPPGVATKPSYEPPVAPRSTPDIKINTNAAPATPPSNERTAEANSRTPTSKTAALIEMYRERERGGTGSVPPLNPPAIVVQPLNVSRIPVRSASVPAKDTPSKDIASIPSIPSPAATPSPAPSPKPSPPEPPALNLPPTATEDPGRISPARYVHGAPLHNVMEEEEEEE